MKLILIEKIAIALAITTILSTGAAVYLYVRGPERVLTEQDQQIIQYAGYCDKLNKTGSGVPFARPLEGCDN